MILFLSASVQRYLYIHSNIAKAKGQSSYLDKSRNSWACWGRPGWGQHPRNAIPHRD